MKIFDDIKLELDESRILHLLGYKDKLPKDEILKSIREEISKFKDSIKPAVCYEYINIDSNNNDFVILENKVIFEGEFIAGKLKSCNKIIAVIATLGEEANQKIEKAFEEGDYLKALIIDNISTEAIGYVNKLFWNKIVDSLNNTNIGLTQTLSPGDTEWDLKEQTKIFACMGDDFKEVKLNDSYLMIPTKSTALIYGFGENIGIAKKEHICTECSMKHCAYRSDDKIPVTIESNGKKEIIDVEKNSNLLVVLKNNNYFIDSPCNGSGTCGKCKVMIKKGNSLPDSQDMINFSEEEIKAGCRLACRIKVNEKIEIVLNQADNSMNIMTDGITDCFDEKEVNTAVKKIHCSMEKPTLEDQRDDLTRLKNSLNMNNLNININDIKNIGKNLRKNDFDVTAVLYRDEFLLLEKGNSTDDFYGIAADIGTTTVAVYLLNLNSGKTIDVESKVNAQRNYGADVISRINYSSQNNDNLNMLKDTIIYQLNSMIENLCNKNNIKIENIYDVSVVGNTSMVHLLLGVPCENIAIAPYIPAFLNSLTMKACEAGLKTNGILSIMPGIASYVGSDITAGILSCNMLDSEEYSLLLDIGTNGEMALGNKDGIITCSTAAGPAFEGANIKYGMGGVNGAVSKIDLSKEKIYETINNQKPIGICGSGVLDAVAQMLKYNIINKNGKMLDLNQKDNLDLNLSSRLIEKDKMKQFIIAQKEDSEQITFTQKDVREVQLAKSAINAGIQIMLKEKKLNYEHIDKVYMGGGFGNYMDIESAAAIGLIPKELKDKVISVGNCAGIGAKAYLLSNDWRKKSEEIISKTKYIELSTRSDFMDFFMKGMMLE